MATQITVDANDLLRIMALCNLTDNLSVMLSAKLLLGYTRH